MKKESTYKSRIGERVGIRLKTEFPGYKEERQFERTRTDGSHLYLTEKEVYLLKVSWSGIFLDAKNTRVNGRYLYVRLLDGTLYASKVNQEDSVGHHSYLSNGKKVLSAGYFHFERGKLMLVSNESGHYKPTNEEMLADLAFYLSVSKNNNLLYEDHSAFAHTKKIYRYKVTEFLYHSEPRPMKILENVSSNYPKKLKSKVESKFDWLNKFSLYRKVKSQKNHYLPDNHLAYDSDELLNDCKVSVTS